MPANGPNHFAITKNAERIRKLRANIGVGYRNRLDDNGASWKAAVARFDAEYEGLAFPGGISSAYSRIESGDAASIEHALEFVEAHPYFFRSQYARVKIVRSLKRVTLSLRQTERLHAALAVDRARKETKHKFMPNRSMDPAP